MIEQIVKEEPRIKVKEIIHGARNLEEMTDLSIQEIAILIHAYEHNYFTSPEGGGRRPAMRELSKDFGISTTTYQRALAVARDKIISNFIEYKLKLD
ncbi:hypothetical protein HN924_02525 [Candidatus Woesearchaeota archaeon]|jgi:predicted DNA binding protein|nr:hypothetical protein [Candidatus Woesearchaeota archaeon]MBT7062819.1 hypothetical protein [Candidatus Woesearchaeota archaeon]MBT7402847.1 hypothetical protein [Candidatus Woesearchaeota archaeon]